MKQEQFIQHIINQLNSILDEWFDQNTLQDQATKAIVKTMIEANKHKFNTMLNVVTDETGEVRTDILMKHLEDMLPASINIDLQQYADQFNIPKMFVPNKILILDKSDIRNLLA
jgi:hypothetical protein